MVMMSGWIAADALDRPTHAERVPGGRQMLVAREAGVDGKYERSFELMRLDTLAAEREAQDPDTLGAFRRWQDPRWKRLTLSVR